MLEQRLDRVESFNQTTFQHMVTSSPHILPSLINHYRHIPIHVAWITWITDMFPRVKVFTCEPHMLPCIKDIMWRNPMKGPPVAQ